MPMIAEPTTLLRPRGSNLLVKFVETADQTSGGIFLPERMRENFTEALVLDKGPGRLEPLWFPILGSTKAARRFQPWPSIGDVVVFESHNAQRINDQEAIIDAEKCLGVSYGEAFYPLADWVAVWPDKGAQVSAGGIRLADRVQRWRQRGTISEYGPGLLIMEGTCALRRRTVHAILGLKEEIPLSGLTVYWKRDATILQLGRERVELWLVKAGDLVAYEENDNAEGSDREWEKE